MNQKKQKTIVRVTCLVIAILMMAGVFSSVVFALL